MAQCSEVQRLPWGLEIDSKNKELCAALLERTLSGAEREGVHTSGYCHNSAGFTGKKINVALGSQSATCLLAIDQLAVHQRKTRKQAVSLSQVGIKLKGKPPKSNPAKRHEFN